MSFAVLATTDQLQDDCPFAIEHGEHELLIISHAGQLFAIANECSHARVPLADGQVSECAIECQAHGARFDLRTGQALTKPATRPIEVFPVKVDGTSILVDLDHPVDFSAEAK